MRESYESLARYKWRFRMVALKGAIEHGVGMVRVEGALKRLGCGLDSESHPLGPDVTVTSQDTLPDGTIVYVGSPDNPRQLAILRYTEGTGYQRIFGDRMESVLTVAVVPGRPDATPAWWADPGTPEDADRIKVFKARAWRVGYKVKQQAGWCPTYEHIMATADLTIDALNDAKHITHNGWAVGDQVQSQAQAQTLPEGTYLVWDGGMVDGQRKFMVSVRDDAMTNDSKCRRVMANVTGNYRNNSTVGQLPDLDMDPDPEEPLWAVRMSYPAQVIEALPVGAVFRYAECRYVVAKDRLLITQERPGETPEYGQHQPAAFNNSGEFYLMGDRQ